MDVLWSPLEQALVGTYVFRCNWAVAACRQPTRRSSGRGQLRPKAGLARSAPHGSPAPHMLSIHRDLFDKHVERRESSRLSNPSVTRATQPSARTTTSLGFVAEQSGGIIA